MTPDDPTAPSSRPATARREWRLPPTPTSARQARAVARDYLSQSSPAFQDAAALVVSELVSNAVLHAGGAGPDIALRLSVDNGYLHVEVEDGDPTPPTPRSVGDDAAHGRGLHIVDRVADRWGWTKVHDDGKHVWCDLWGWSPAE